MKTKLILVLAVISMVFASCIKTNQKPPKIEIEDFFKNPEQAYFKISPSGQFISYTAPYESRMNLFIKEVGQDLKQIVILPDTSGQMTIEFFT